MITTIHIAILILLTIIVWQDLKQRAVSLVLFPCLFIGSFSLLILNGGNWKQWAMNILFIFVLISGLFIYVSLKNKKITNIFKAHFGLGDVLFLVAVTPLFNNRNMILYVIFGMVLSLIIHVFAGMLGNHGAGKATVPLAGYLAAFLGVIIVINLFSSTNIFYSNLLK